MSVGALAALALASAATASTPVVPWLDQRPLPASAHPALAPACRASELHAHLFLQGETGSLVGGVDLRNAGRSACSLLGWPRVSFTGPAAGATPWRVKRRARTPGPPDVITDPPGSLRALRPGKSAVLSLDWSNWCGPGSQSAGRSGKPPDGLRIALASGTNIDVPLAHAPRCDVAESPSLLTIEPFTPTTRRLPPSSRLPLAVAIVGPRPVIVKAGLRGFRVHRGELLRYRVVLTNTGDTVFRFARTSCPTYIEQLAGWPARPYVLNCRPVAPIRPRGKVLFEMQIPVPPQARRGNNSLTWQLAPKTYDAPFAPASVWVVR